MSKSISSGAVNDISAKFQDVSYYIDDFDKYLASFKDIYGIALVIFGSVVSVSAIVGAIAFWFRIKILVYTYMVFILCAIVAEYVFGSIFVIYAHKDHFPFGADSISKSILKALDTGYCDDAGIGIDDSSAANAYFDLFRQTQNSTVVSSEVNDIIDGCPVYTPGMDCDAAKEQCVSAITRYLVSYLGPIGMWLCIIASAMVIVCGVALYFLWEHHLWLSRKRSDEIRKVLGNDTLVRHVTIQAMYQAKSDGTFDSLSPLSSLKKSLPPAIAQEISEDLEEGLSPGTVVTNVEDTLSLHGSAVSVEKKSGRTLAGHSFGRSLSRSNARMARLLTEDFKRDSCALSDIDSDRNTIFAAAWLRRHTSNLTDSSSKSRSRSLESRSLDRLSNVPSRSQSLDKSTPERSATDLSAGSGEIGLAVLAHQSRVIRTFPIPRRDSSSVSSEDRSREDSHDTVTSLGHVSMKSDAMAARRLERERNLQGFTSSIILPPVGFARSSSDGAAMDGSHKVPYRDDDGSQKAPSRIVLEVRARSNPTQPASVSRVSFADSATRPGHDSSRSSGMGRVPVRSLAGWWEDKKVGRLAKHPDVDDGDSDSDCDLNTDDFSPNKAGPEVFTNNPSATPAGTVTSGDSNRPTRSSFAFGDSFMSQSFMSKKQSFDQGSFEGKGFDQHNFDQRSGGQSPSIGTDESMPVLGQYVMTPPQE